jgi:hypothetical protein
MNKIIFFSIIFLILISAIVLGILFKGEENYILKHGQKLTEEQLNIAQLIGIKNPQKIRVLIKNKIYGQNHIAGLTINSGILIKSDYQYDRYVIIHELVHVRQYQDVGGIYNFLRIYLVQIAKYGYEKAPLEIEARTIAERIINEE